jgi:hypothetical protein
MPNHVHLVVVPEDKDGLSRAVGEAHRRYTNFINARGRWTGHRGESGSAGQGDAGSRDRRRAPRRGRSGASAAIWALPPHRVAQQLLHVGVKGDGRPGHSGIMTGIPFGRI